MRVAALLISIVISHAAVSSDEVLWQPKAATVPAAVADAEQRYQQKPDDINLAAELVESYLTVIRRSDRHDLLKKARDIQSSVADKEQASQSLQWLIASADLYQYQHQFDQAQRQLMQVIDKQPQHLQASLMLARIALAQGRTKQAKTHCARLFGSHALGVVSTCLLEVEGRGERPAMAYDKLARLQQQNDSPNASQTIKQWRLQILAEQAVLLGKYQEARQWLSQLPKPHTIVEQKLLLDSYLFDPSTAPPQNLIPSCDANIVDAVAVRLARARQSTKDDCWEQYAKQRIQLRTLRNDTLHSADIAYYYTYVEPNPEAALHWAEVNYSVAKEPFDRRLLKQAKQLVGSD